MLLHSDRQTATQTDRQPLRTDRQPLRTDKQTLLDITCITIHAIHTYNTINNNISLYMLPWAHMAVLGTTHPSL